MLRNNKLPIIEAWRASAVPYDDDARVLFRVAPDWIFSNPAGAGFGIADPAGAGAGAECS